MGAALPSEAARQSGGRRVVAVCYGVICHVCVALGVLAMMVSMFFGMSRSLGILPDPWSWVANAALDPRNALHGILGPARQVHGRCRACPADRQPGVDRVASRQETRLPVDARDRVPTWTPDQLVVAGTLTAYCLVAPLFKEARFRRIYGAAFDKVRPYGSVLVPVAAKAAVNGLSIVYVYR